MNEEDVKMWLLIILFFVVVFWLSGQLHQGWSYDESNDGYGEYVGPYDF